MTFLVDEKRLAELVPAWIKAKTPLQEGEWAEEYAEDLIDFAEYALKVVRAAQNAMPQLACDSPAEITCRACKLKKALEPFSQGEKESK